MAKKKTSRIQPTPTNKGEGPYASSMRRPTMISYDFLQKKFPGGFRDNSPLISLFIPPRFKWGQADIRELTLICEITRCLNPKIVFEFGRYDGLTTLNLAQHAPSADIYTLDLPRSSQKLSDKSYDKKAPSRARERWKTYKVETQITEVLKDSRRFNPTEYAEGKLMKKVDLVFIDGGHDYEIVKKDTRSAEALLKPGGIIIWHDYNKRGFPGVTAFIAEYQQIHYNEIYWIESYDNSLKTSICFTFM